MINVCFCFFVVAQMYDISTLYGKISYRFVDFGKYRTDKYHTKFEEKIDSLVGKSCTHICQINDLSPLLSTHFSILSFLCGKIPYIFVDFGKYRTENTVRPKTFFLNTDRDTIRMHTGKCALEAPFIFLMNKRIVRPLR